MDSDSAYSPAVCLRLIDDNAHAFGHHCSLCAFFHARREEGSQEEPGCDCEHPKHVPDHPFRSATPFSETSFSSFYTALTARAPSPAADRFDDYTPRADDLPPLDSDSDSRSLSSWSSSSTIRAIVQPSLADADLKQRRSLRRTSSPTECSLRDLHQKQRGRSPRSCGGDDPGLRLQLSDEKLQRVYESQILAYLDGNYADLETIGVAWCPLRKAS